MQEVKLTAGFGLIMKNEEDPFAVQPYPEIPETSTCTELLLPFQRKVAPEIPCWEVSVPMEAGITLQVKLPPAWAGTLKAEL